MTNEIGRIFGGSNYGIGGYVPSRKGEETPQPQEQTVAQNYEETQVDPAKVMDFLAQNNYFVDITNTPAVVGVETDPSISDRVAGYMENFEKIYAVVEEEFGSAKASMVMDVLMDRLMGLVQ